MDKPNNTLLEKVVFFAQVLSVSLIWIFVIAITIWIANLISLSLELQDMPGASVGISIVAIPVFIILASVLTYVFVGLQKEKRQLSRPSEEN